MSKTYRELTENYLQDQTEYNYAQLYSKIRPGLYNYIKKIIKDEEAAQDILANTMVKMWTKIDQFDPSYQITTWLYRIAFNESLGWIRERNRKYSLDNMHEFGIEVNENGGLKGLTAQDLLNDFDDMTEQDHWDQENELMQTYHSALRGIEDLKPMYQSILEDRLLNNMKYEDIAEKHQINLQTVKNRIRRGKMLISEFIERG